MSRGVLLVSLVACSAAPPPPPVVGPWPTPAGYKSETIPFPLDFAPGLPHAGVEELRFAPGFFDPAAPGYWSYAFTWRTQDPAELAPEALAAELTVYFRGLIAAVDEPKQQVKDHAAITTTARADGARITLTAHVFDAFGTGAPVELTGWARRTTCRPGALWVVVLAPAASGVRAELDALAAQARC